MDILPSHWRPLPDVPVIQRVWKERHSHRWTVTAAGRRALKTHLAKMRLSEAALDTPDGFFFVVMSELEQTRAVYWEDLQELLPVAEWSYFDHGRLNIRLKNGAEIQLGRERQLQVLAEQPAENRPKIDGLVLDGFEDMTALAWPAARVLVKKGWIWVVGVPPTPTQPAPHFTSLWEGATTDTTGTWGAYNWSAADVLMPNELDALREVLDPVTFRAEILGEFFSLEAHR